MRYIVRIAAFSALPATTDGYEFTSRFYEAIPGRIAGFAVVTATLTR